MSNLWNTLAAKGRPNHEAPAERPAGVELVRPRIGSLFEPQSLAPGPASIEQPEEAVKQQPAADDLPSGSRPMERQLSPPGQEQAPIQERLAQRPLDLSRPAGRPGQPPFAIRLDTIMPSAPLAPNSGQEPQGEGQAIAPTEDKVKPAGAGQLTTPGSASNQQGKASPPHPLWPAKRGSQEPVEPLQSSLESDREMPTLPLTEETPAIQETQKGLETRIIRPRITARSESAPGQAIEPWVRSYPGRFTEPEATGRRAVGPNVRVHIGRIEVRAETPAQPSPTRPATRQRYQPPLSLDDYLRQRSEGQT